MYDRLKAARLRSLNMSLVYVIVPMAGCAAFKALRVISVILGFYLIILLYARICLAVKYRRLEKSYPGDLNAECESCTELVLPCYFFLREGFLEAANADYVRYDEIELIEASSEECESDPVNDEDSSDSKEYRILITAGSSKLCITKLGRQGEEAKAYAEMCRLFAVHVSGEKIKTTDT